MRYEWRLKLCDEIAGVLFDLYTTVPVRPEPTRGSRTQQRAVFDETMNRVYRMAFTTKLYFSSEESTELLNEVLSLDRVFGQIRVTVPDESLYDEFYSSFEIQHTNVLRVIRRISETVPKTRVTWPAVTQMLE